MGASCGRVDRKGRTVVLLDGDAEGKRDERSDAESVLHVDGMVLRLSSNSETIKMIDDVGRRRAEATTKRRRIGKHRRGDGRKEGRREKQTGWVA